MEKAAKSDQICLSSYNWIMSELDLRDFDLFLRAFFGTPGEAAIAVEELLKRDKLEAARLQSMEIEGDVNKPRTVESGQSGDRPSRLKG